MLRWGGGLVLAAYGAACCAQSAANDEEMLALLYGDQHNVSIATGSQQPLRRAPAVASVITAADINAMGAIDLDAALESVPGLHVSRMVVESAPLYIVRGVYGGALTNPHVLMLQNGLPVTSVYAGDKGNIWGGLPLENVARIEVMRGPGSALYGADAYAGVINIITKTAVDAPGTRLGMRVGSFDSADAWWSYGGDWAGFDAYAYLRVGTTQGATQTIEADAQTRLDGLFGTHASLAPGPLSLGGRMLDGSLDLSRGHWRLRLGYKQRQGLGSGAGVASALDPTGRANNIRGTAEIEWRDPQAASDWELGATAAAVYFQESVRLVLFPPGVRFPTGSFPAGVIGGPDRWDRQFRVSAYGLYSGLANHRLRLGGGHEDLNLYRTETHKNYFLNPAGVPVPTGPVIEYSAIQPHILPHRRHLDYVYAQDEWQLGPDWTLTAGLRHDRYSDVGSTTNPRLALVWEAGLDVTVKLLHGRAFRAPSFSELYGVNSVANGNPTIRPELIATTEGVLAWQVRQGLQVSFSVFHQVLRDLIRPVQNPAPAPGLTYQNTGTERGRGAELELVWDPRPTLRLSANLAVQRTIDTATDHDAGYAPHEHAYLRADWRFAPKWLASSQLNHVGRRERAAGDARSPIADYTTLDLSLRRSAGRPGWEIGAGVQNIAAADAREPTLAPGLAVPHDMPVLPRALYVQASYAW